MPDTPAKPFVDPSPASSDFRAPGALPDFPDHERRRRPRVLLEMPVRMRWLGPFGLETELTHTRNASRDGLLVTSANIRQIGTRLWTTFPYDPAVAFTESETPGRVSRCDATRSNGKLIAVEFPIAASIHRMTRLLYRFPLAASRAGIAEVMHASRWHSWFGLRAMNAFWAFRARIRNRRRGPKKR